MNYVSIIMRSFFFYPQKLPELHILYEGCIFCNILQNELTWRCVRKCDSPKKVCQLMGRCDGYGEK